MTNDFLYNFIRRHKYGVISSVSMDNTAQSACIGIVVTPDLKLIFDTVTDSRKYKNILINPNVSFVIGCDNEQTIQYEGIALRLENEKLEHLLVTYFEEFPDGKDRRQNWKNIAYFIVEPKWIRYSEFNGAAPIIEEIRF